MPAYLKKTEAKIINLFCQLYLILTNLFLTLKYKQTLLIHETVRIPSFPQLAMSLLEIWQLFLIQECNQLFLRVQNQISVPHRLHKVSGGNRC